MPILVGKMDTRRQTLLRAFQEYFDGGMGNRSVPVTFQYSFFGETSGFVQEGRKCVTRGFVPASMDDAEAGKIKPDRQGSEPVDGILVAWGVLSEFAKKFGVLVGILCRMTPQKSGPPFSGRPIRSR
jgi:hypothetical protein